MPTTLCTWNHFNWKKAGSLALGHSSGAKLELRNYWTCSESFLLLQLLKWSVSSPWGLLRVACSLTHLALSPHGHLASLTPSCQRAQPLFHFHS